LHEFNLVVSCVATKLNSCNHVKVQYSSQIIVHLRAIIACVLVQSKHILSFQDEGF